MADGVLDEYARVSRSKEAAEAEIAAIVEELTSGLNPGGVSGPLVDAEGFPRADIDVYRVRHQRHRLACLQTDHTAAMRRIEQLLPLVFEAKMTQQQQQQQSASTKRETPPPAVSTPVSVHTEPEPRAIADIDRAKEPFAVVDNVQAESPAEAADLRAGDQVVEFGTADASNHRELAAVREIVVRNVGSAIRVLVRRQSGEDYEWLELQLTPQQWRGPGVLGCLLMPLVDRP